VGVRSAELPRLAPVASATTVRTLLNQTVEPVLSGLYDIKQVSGTQGAFIYIYVIHEVIQSGTSPIENFNNILGGFRNRSQGFVSMETLDIIIGLCVLQFNLMCVVQH